MKVLLGTKVEGVEDTGSGVRVTVSPAAGGDQQVLEADKLLSAIGFAPRIEGYGLESAGVALTDRGAVAIDEYCRTNVPNVYAIGDCTAKLMLAHVAEARASSPPRRSPAPRRCRSTTTSIPRATFCQPQIASFGYSEAQAKEKGYDVKTATFPFTANGKARARGCRGLRQGRRRRQAQRDPRRAHDRPRRHRAAAGADAAQKWDLTADEVARNVFAHPTLCEAVKEAVEGIAGHMINL